MSIISGDKTRVSRTDDLSRDIKSASGQTVGGVNNQLFDIISIGEDGSYIEGSARQLKYVGKNASEPTHVNSARRKQAKAISGKHLNSRRFAQAALPPRRRWPIS